MQRRVRTIFSGFRSVSRVVVAVARRGQPVFSVLIRVLNRVVSSIGAVVVLIVGRVGSLIVARLPEKFRPSLRFRQTLARGRGVVSLVAGVILLMLVPVAIWQLSAPSRQVDAAWFDGSYGYRKRLPVSNSSGTAQTDFQLQLSLDTASLITAGKLQSDCDDMRFTAENGQVLDYWYESGCNTATTTVHVKVPSVPTSGANIYWYYGNPTTGNASNPDNTFIANQAGAVAWPLDDPSGQSYARTTHPADEEGRIFFNQPFDSAGSWNTSGGSIANGVLSLSGSGGLNYLSTSTLISGKAYKVTFTVSNYTSGTVRPYLFGTSGTARSANGTYSELLVAGTTNVFVGFNPSSFTGDLDDLTIAEVNIPSSAATPTQLLADGDMEASGTTSWLTFNGALPTKETTNPHGGSQLLRLTRGTANTQPQLYQENIFVVGQIYRISGYARSDGFATPRVYVGSDIASFTTSTSWQPFDVIVKPTITSFQLIENTTALGQYVEFDNIVISQDNYIRSGELLQDGNMEASGTGSWEVGTAGTISKETTSPHGGTQVIRIARSGSNNPTYFQNILVPGKKYRVTGYIRGDGSAQPAILEGSTGTGIFTGTSSTSWQSVDVTFTSTGAAPGRLHLRSVTSTGTQYAEFDDLSVTEISPLVGTPANGVVQGASTGAGGHLTSAYTFDGTNDAVNIYSPSLNSTFNPDEGTLVVWAKYTGTWNDGGGRWIASIRGSSHYIYLYKVSNGSLAFQYNVMGGAKTVTVTNQSADWMKLALTWSKSKDELKAYINGSQVGTTQTGLGNWADNLASTTTVIGAFNTSGGAPWSGQINDVRLYDRALTAEEISRQYSASSDIQAYTSTTLPNRELLRKYNTNITAGALATEEVTPGPVAYWTFDDGQGQVAQDSTSNNNDGTLGATSGVSTDDPTWVTEDQCVTGKCLKFDGTNDVVNAGGLKYGANKGSTSLWVKPTSTPDGTEEFMFMGERDNNRIYLTRDGTTGNFTIRLGTGLATDTGKNLASGSWYHLAVSWDSGSYTAYVNGVAVLSSTYSGIAGNRATSSCSSMGGYYNCSANNSYFAGFIDEVISYPYARSAAQIQADYNAGAAKLGAQNQANLSNGLIGYWKMDEASWTNNCATDSVLDSSGNNLHGDACPNSTGPTGGAPGKFGNGGLLDGVDDYIDIADTPTVSTFTVSAWIKTSNTGLQNIVTGSGGAGRYISTNGTLRWFDGNNWRLGTTNVADNNWHFVTFVFNNGAHYIYTDGRLEYNNSAGNGTYTNGQFTEIGRVFSGDRWFNGTLDEVRIYNRALSADEVSQLYNYAPGPTGWWKMDENSGTTAVDSSGNGVNGTLTNGPTWATGKMGSGVSFLPADSNKSIVLPSNPLAGYKAFTTSTWAYYDGTAPTTALFGTAGGGSYWRSSGSSNLVMYVLASDCFGHGNVWNTLNTLQSGWHYYTFSIDEAGNMSLYRDVIRINTTTFASLTGRTWDSVCSTSSNWRQIGNYASGEGWGGTLDDFKIYNYARTQSQILEDMGNNPPPSVAGDILPDPVAYYALDEQQGQTVNNSGTGGSGTNGTLGANSSVSTDDPAWKTKADCKQNGCASFDGGDYVTVADDTAIDITRDLTLSTWFKTSSSSNQALIGKWTGTTGNNNQYWLGFVGNSLRLYVSSDGAGSSTFRGRSNAGVKDGQWHHVVAVYNASSASISLYVDGKLQTLDESGGTVPSSLYNSTSPMRIGADSASTVLYFNGSIDETKVYNTALTPDQVKLDYNAGLSQSFGGITTASEESTVIDGAGAPPVAYWNLDEGTGTSANDTSGNGNTGTLNGGPTWGQGKVGNALNFDGVDDYVNVPDPASGILDFADGNSFTLSGWFKTTMNNAQTSLFTKYGTGTSPGYFLRLGNGKVEYVLSDGVTTINGSSTLNYNDGRWHFVSMVFNDASTAEMYVDGVRLPEMSQSVTSLGSMANSIAFMIGNRSGNYFNGSLDDVKFYNYARTPAQVAYDYNRGAPIAKWEMDECQGTTIYDTTGNGNTGTLTVGGSGTQTSAGTCTTASTAWGNGATGKYNSSLNFDGTDDYVAMNPTTVVGNSNTYAIAGWFKTTGTGQRVIFSEGHSASSTQFLHVIINRYNVGDIAFFHRDNSGTTMQIVLDTPAAAARPVNDGAWHHFVVQRLASNSFELYVDSKRVATRSTAPGTTTTNRMCIGAQCQNTVGSYFQGQIDDVAVYNYPLSAAQIRILYNQGGGVRFGPASGSP